MKGFDDLFEIACGNSFIDHINNLKPDEKTASVNLSKNQIAILIQKLNSLPEKYIHLLFLYYNIGRTADIENLLNINNAENHINYLNQILSHSIGLRNSLIDNSSMKIACDTALSNEIFDLTNNKFIENINYSNEFKRNINKIIPHCYKATYKIFSKIAAVIIIMLIGTTSLFSFNVNARQKLLNWLINTFPKYSEFFYDSTDTATSSDLNKYNISYLPRGFNLYEKFESDSMITEEYRDSSDKYIWVLKKVSSNTPINLNTEDTEIQWLIYNGTEYMYWKSDGIHYITWELDGITFSINTNLDEETSIKIAESVKK